MLEVGKPLPVNVVSDTGQLLLRKGQPIVSEQHREKLHAFNASTTPAEAAAWQRAYERMVHQLLREGVDVQEIARASMPSAIRENDYVVGTELSGGWLDLQEVLRGILYQGGLAINPLRRLHGIAKKTAQLLEDDVDDSLFVLFQALADDTLGYCATHALLCAVVSDLTAAKLGVDTSHRQSLMAAALTMNIGMARDQDSLARQTTPPNDWQRELIKNHAEHGATILETLGVDDADQLDIVRWHHQPDAQDGIPANLLGRRILAMADVFVAKMAARKTRSALSPLGAAKSIYLGAEGTASSVGSAMATCVGFYPPGTYLQLSNGETAVAVQRGLRANTPWVISILDKDGMPMSLYKARSTAEDGYTIAAPVNHQKVRVAIPVDKVRRARERIPRQA
jgi:HD-GYP domain-containing protein (c-di-GMP phosphodiesterase class II)